MDSYEKFQPREFEISETSKRKVKRTIIVSIVCSIPFIIAFALWASDFRIEKAFAALGKTLLFCGIIFAIEIPLLKLILRKPKILVEEERFVRQYGKKKQILLWTDIAKIKTIQNTNGIVNEIRIYPKKSMKSMYLSGFQEMENLVNLINERTPDSIVSQEKRWKLDWNNPFILVFAAIVPMMVVMFIIASMGSNAMDIFGITAAFIISLWILIFRPITKLDPSGKWIEIFFGIALLGLSIYLVVYFFFIWKDTIKDL